MVYEQLNGYIRQPAFIQGLTSRLSIHEAIKSQLYVLGYRLGYLPILEASTDKIGQKRHDCVFVSGETVVCAFEIDYSIKLKSIQKLNTLGAGVEKIIISYGRNDAISKAKFRHAAEAGFKHYVITSRFK